MYPIVSVIVVNWNGKYLIGPCLESLRRQTFRDFKVIVVDNGSRDGSPEFVDSNFPEVFQVRLTENTGFTGGNNIGIRAAEGEYIALLNNDARAEENWLRALVWSADRHPRAGMFASKILSPQGLIDSAGCLLYPDGIGYCRGRGEQDRGQFDQLDFVAFPSGCAALYRRAMLDAVDLFDDSFFMYCEDVDLGLRGRAAGWECLYVPWAVVIHLFSQSSSAYSLKKLFHVELNRLRVMRKNFTPGQAARSIPYTFLRYLLLVLRGHGWSRYLKGRSMPNRALATGIGTCGTGK